MMIIKEVLFQIGFKNLWKRRVLSSKTSEKNSEKSN